MSGMDVCGEIKQQSPTVPIIVVRASTEIADKVLLLELGADDYVSKPFSPRELLARVQAAIRHASRPVVRDVTAFDGICVDIATWEVTREDHPVELTEQEFKILKSFHNECGATGGNRKRHFVAGQVVPETVNTLHRGVTGDRPVVLIVFYAGVKGMRLASMY